MTGREKLDNALNHRPGPVPIDFGSNAVTGMHVSVVAAMRDFYGLSKKPVKVIEPFQMLGEIDEELKTIFKADVDGIQPYGTIFGFPNKDWKQWRTPWGQEVLVPGRFNTAKQGKDTVIYPKGDTSVPPSGRMPESGYFFDSIIRQKPIDEDKLDPKDNQEEFVPVTEEDLAYYKSVLASFEGSSRGLFANFGGTGLGDIALVPGPFMTDPKGIRDVTEWYVSTAARRDYLHAVFTYQTDMALQNLSKIHAAAGDKVQVMFLCGTDFGTQSSTFCSAETFRELYKPYYRKMSAWIRANTKWKTFKHSCGAVKGLLGEFIESGFDILNPVQLSASGMDPVELKDRFGSSITFWGGGVDTQKTLPFGTPEEVRREVLERCSILSPGGGFVFNAIHNVQAKTPVKNVAAMISAVHEFNGEKK